MSSPRMKRGSERVFQLKKAVDLMTMDTFHQEKYPQILAQIFNYIGNGEWLYIAGVSKSWRKLYTEHSHNALATDATAHSPEHQVDHTIKPTSSDSNANVAIKTSMASSVETCTTLPVTTSRQSPPLMSTFISSAFLSTSRLQYACSCGMVQPDRINILLAHPAPGPLSQSNLHRRWETCSISVRTISNFVGWTKKMLLAAGMFGSKETLTWCWEHGMTWDQNLCTGASMSGRLDILQWLHTDTKCPMDIFNVSILSAQNGNVDILKWIWDLRGERWLPGNTSNVVFEAAKYGQLGVLQWLKEIGCLWEGMTVWEGHAPHEVYAVAYGNKHTQAAYWLREEGFHIVYDGLETVPTLQSL